MAQKPVLRGEVGCACVAREVSVERRGMGERGCARRLGGWVSDTLARCSRECSLITLRYRALRLDTNQRKEKHKVAEHS